MAGRQWVVLSFSAWVQLERNERKMKRAAIQTPNLSYPK
jgi:hypothetical protein